MSWFVYAILGALIWGVHYNLIEKSLTAISPFGLYFVPTIPLLIGLPFYWNHLVKDYISIKNAPIDIQLSVSIIAFTGIAASLFIYKAIQGSNATVASLIEITYPVFVAIFALLIFNENHFSWSTVTGGLMIMAGTAVIIYNN